MHFTGVTVWVRVQWDQTAWEGVWQGWGLTAIVWDCTMLWLHASAWKAQVRNIQFTLTHLRHIPFLTHFTVQSTWHGTANSDLVHYCYIWMEQSMLMTHASNVVVVGKCGCVNLCVGRCGGCCALCTNKGKGWHAQSTTCPHSEPNEVIPLSV